MFEADFKTEDQVRGESLARSVSISGSSDSGVRAFVDKCKVSLVSEGVESQSFTANCSCAQGRKNRLCAHVWAVLVRLEGSDFLSAKTEIESVSSTGNEYRKQQASRQKEYLRKQREEKKLKENGSRHQVQYPAEVEEALRFFSGNGFHLESLDMDALVQAKKVLSRVFHPDKGGSHDEVIELNHHFDIIAGYLK